MSPSHTQLLKHPPTRCFVWLVRLLWWAARGRGHAQVCAFIYEGLQRNSGVPHMVKGMVTDFVLEFLRPNEALLATVPREVRARAGVA